MALLAISESSGQNNSLSSMRGHTGLKTALSMHSITATKAFAHCTAGYWTFTSTIQKKKKLVWVNIVSCWKSSLLQADNGYVTVRARPNGYHSLISAEPPGVLIRTFPVNNQTGNCSLTAGNFHQTAVNLCIRLSSFSLTWRVIPIRQQLILIIQSVS